ncbi:MAG: hypothetical protein KDD62_09345, partial [Bdellovibrionales bacterium]|nr:hypothetical protein [Bdellovibrionales bacterium]
MTQKEESHKQESHWPLTIMSCLAALCNVIIPLVLVRTLSPEEVGTFKIFFLYIMLAPLFSLASGFVSGFAYWGGQGSQGRTHLQASCSFLLTLAFITTIVALTLADPVSKLLSWPVSVGYLFALCLAPGILHNFFEELSIAQGRVQTGARFYAIFELLRAGLLALTAGLSESLFAVLLVHTVVANAKLFIGVLFAIQSG